MDDYINRLENNDPTLVELDLWREENIDKKRFMNSLKNNTYLQYYNRSLNIVNNTYLQYLKICCNENNLGMDKIIKIFKHSTSLKKLVICYVWNINENGIDKIINSLKVNITLQILDISIGYINDNNAIEIANMLRVNTTLQKLILYDNDISKPGLIEIVNALRINTSLKIFDVRNNKFKSRDVVDEIIEILQYNYTLEQLKGVDLGDFLSPENRSLRRRFLTTKCAKKS